MKFPDDLTLRISTNARDKTTTIVAYRTGGFKRAYKAVIPMCQKADCKQVGRHTISYNPGYRNTLSYHQSDVDSLVMKLVKSYR